jgi:hypothetical protein
MDIDVSSLVDLDAAGRCAPSFNPHLRRFAAQMTPRAGHGWFSRAERATARVIFAPGRDTVGTMSDEP